MKTRRPDLSLFKAYVDTADLYLLKKMYRILVRKINEKENNNIKIRTNNTANTKTSLTSPKQALNKLMSEDWGEIFCKYDTTNYDNYVYLHVDPRSSDAKYNVGDKTLKFKHPFYVGVGRGNRIYEKSARSRMHVHQIKHYLADGFSEKEIMVYFESGLTEAKARELEAKLILFFGVKSAFTQRTVKKKVHALCGKQPSLVNNQYEPMPEEYIKYGFEGINSNTCSKQIN